MEKENRLSIGKINGIEIAAVRNESGEIHVPIKPICEAIGIAADAQRNKIQSDITLASVASIINATGSDGKSYGMVCLPIKYIYGWLFTINPGKVDPDARESVIKYRQECYDVLYDHFERRTRRQNEENQAEIRILEEINGLLSQEKTLKCQLKERRNDLAKIRAARLDDQPMLFD